MHRCYGLWQNFNKELEKKLEVFLQEQAGVTSEQVYGSVERVQAYDP